MASVAKTMRSRSRRGDGSIRERRPGVWEIRVTTGVDPSTGKSKQTSFTHHGDCDGALRRQAELVGLYGFTRPSKTSPTMPTLIVQELLEKFMKADHRWSETTWRTYRGQVAMLVKDRIRRARVDRMTPAKMQRALDRWAQDDMTATTLHRRYKTLHAAMRWAVRSGLLFDDPLAAMQTPAGPPARPCARPGEIHRLMNVADAKMKAAADAVTRQPHKRRLHLALFRAERDALMVRLASDAALHRGEIVALKTDDLFERNLSVVRTSRDGVIHPLTNHRRATLTLSEHTAACWSAHVERWHEVPEHGPWLIASTPERTQPLTPGGLGQRFAKLAELAGLPEASLQRLRHTVGTYLVAEGKVMQASKRLRHRDVATTYREYRYAAPTDDQEVADRIAQLYGFDDM